MCTSLLYHTFGIRGYEYVRTEYQGGQVIFTINQDLKTCRCSACGARFDVALLWTGFITRPGIPWGNCYG